MSSSALHLGDAIYAFARLKGPHLVKAAINQAVGTGDAMPQQEAYFEQQIGAKRIIVLKSYDRVFAREAFEHMDEKALRFLGRALKLEESGNPGAEDPNYADTLWEEIEDGAREDWNAFSYFIVTEQTGTEAAPVFVSPEWPIAEAFAKERIELNPNDV
jgi:hypothetical protein